MLIPKFITDIHTITPPQLPTKMTSNDMGVRENSLLSKGPFRVLLELKVRMRDHIFVIDPSGDNGLWPFQK